MNQLEQEIVGMISAAGDSKAKAFEALKMVKDSRYDEARELLAQARKIDLEAHKIQTKLITAEMSDSDEKPEIGLLMVHAQDHYMTSQLARDLIEEMINVFDCTQMHLFIHPIGDRRQIFIHKCLKFIKHVSTLAFFFIIPLRIISAYLLFFLRSMPFS